jgi:hypothetical protein
MMRISRRARVLAFGGLILVFAAALVLLRPVAAPLSDAEYVAIAKDTPQGQLYFKSHTAPCSVARVWNYTAGPGVPTEKFRVYIDPRTSQVVDTDMSFNP